MEQLVRSLEEAREPRFVVIDGAQEFCHVSADLRNDFCDLYLAGCHKWLQAYHPMGLAFYGRRRSQFIIETALKDLVTAGQLDDPLLRFSKQAGVRYPGRPDGDGQPWLPLLMSGGCRRCSGGRWFSWPVLAETAEQPHGSGWGCGGEWLELLAATAKVSDRHPAPSGGADEEESVV